MKNIVLMASGSGSNAENIINYFKNTNINCRFYIITNKKDAFVLERAKKMGVPAEIISKKETEDGVLRQRMLEINPDLIVLAGYLLLLPSEIIREFPNKILNIHPALLPKYGGKGMYGRFVHEAVLNNKETETGISIHYVNENYDEGAIIFQKATKISPEDTAATIAEKVHKLEHEWFPKIIEKELLNG